METNTKTQRILINLGCGPMAARTRWQDYDGSWNVLASHLPFGIGWLVKKLLGHRGSGFPKHVRYLDVTRRLPFADQSVDVVYFSHVLEHLYLDEGRRLLMECHRILKPGGIIRVLVPDTEYFLKNYLSKASAKEVGACMELNERLGYRLLTGRGNMLRRLYAAAADFHTHKFMYDRQYLAECLSQVGFVSLEEAIFGISRVPEVSEVESESRVGNGLGFGFEAVRL